MYSKCVLLTVMCQSTCVTSVCFTSAEMFPVHLYFLNVDLDDVIVSGPCYDDVTKVKISDIICDAVSKMLHVGIRRPETKCLAPMSYRHHMEHIMVKVTS